jgi:hypothetical protein
MIIALMDGRCNFSGMNWADSKPMGFSDFFAIQGVHPKKLEAPAIKVFKGF